MSSSIFSVPVWSAGANYKTHDIVTNGGGSYWYSLKNSNLGNALPSISDTNWGGYIRDTDGSTRPQFLWKASYASPVNFEPRVTVVKFAGYEQRVPQLINSNPLIFDVKFSERKIDEATAIAHFLYTRGGTEFFVWFGFPPFVAQARYVCRKWTVPTNFYNNYEINATFEQVAA